MEYLPQTEYNYAKHFKIPWWSVSIFCRLEKQRKKIHKENLLKDMKDEKDEKIEKVWKKVWNSNFVYKINDPNTLVRIGTM